MVDDPSACPDQFPTEAEQIAERSRLHGLIRRLIVWKDVNDEHLLGETRHEIARSVARARGDTAPDKPDDVLRYLSRAAPPVYDPFCGGGSISLEAQRLGLCARASDLNPLPVLITKALIELPPQFHNQKPVNPDADPLGMFVNGHKKTERASWRGTAGLADDIRYYGKWMREEAYKRIGHLYPKAQLRNGDAATVVAWLWARIVPCGNPACGVQMPLLSTFQLSKKKSNEHWIKPSVDRESKQVTWTVQTHDEGVPKAGTVNKNGAVCIACGAAVKLPYVREQGKSGKMGQTLIAIVVDGNGSKLYLSPTEEHIQVALEAKPTWRPRGSLPEKARSISIQLYGFTEWYKLFTDRQTVALNTFGDLLSEVLERLKKDGAEADYATAVCTYLALAIGRTAESGSSFTIWNGVGQKIEKVFGRQGIGMVWDYPEANPFSTSTQNWIAQVQWIAKVIATLPSSTNRGEVYQADAATTIRANKTVIITDPPYYDNIHYADSSDFFYVWLRPLLRNIYPNLFAGIMTPKQEEIVANRFRFDNYKERFEELLKKTILQFRQGCSLSFPALIMYAYKQQNEDRDGKTSSGWETMLSAVIKAGFQIVATWPMRTEQSRALKTNINSLASSVVLVCRPRSENAPNIDRRTFLRELAKEMPLALDRLTRVARINPVDLAQAAIGPGMEVYLALQQSNAGQR